MVIVLYKLTKGLLKPKYESGYLAFVSCGRGFSTDKATEELVWQMQQFNSGTDFYPRARYIAKGLKFGVILPSILIHGVMVCLACLRRRQELEVNAIKLKTDPGERDWTAVRHEL
jgi:hypothetical protein